MKLAIVKQRYIPGYTWRSHQWHGANEMLDDFMLRSKNFGLLHAFQTDVLVIGDRDSYLSSTYDWMLQNKPVETAALYAAQPQCDDVTGIKFDEYDVVISLDPVIPKSVIDKYPTVLWCYCASEHHSKEWTGDLPDFGYDLFLDHTFNAFLGNNDGLPANAHFPLVATELAFRDAGVVSDEKEASAFFDSQAIRKKPDLAAWRWNMEESIGLPVRHPKPWDFTKSYQAVAEKQQWSTREYLTEVSKSRYFVLARNGGGYCGQSAPEAAALGCLVVATDSWYTTRLCSPQCLLGTEFDQRRLAAQIARLEGTPRLFGEALAYQTFALRKVFCDDPIKVLQRWLQVKRGE